MVGVKRFVMAAVINDPTTYVANDGLKSLIYVAIDTLVSKKFGALRTGDQELLPKCIEEATGSWFMSSDDRLTETAYGRNEDKFEAFITEGYYKGYIADEDDEDRIKFSVHGMKRMLSDNLDSYSRCGSEQYGEFGRLVIMGGKDISNLTDLLAYTIKNWDSIHDEWKTLVGIVAHQFIDEVNSGVTKDTIKLILTDYSKCALCGIDASSMNETDRMLKGIELSESGILDKAVDSIVKDITTLVEIIMRRLATIPPQEYVTYFADTKYGGTIEPVEPDSEYE